MRIKKTKSNPSFPINLKQGGQIALVSGLVLLAFLLGFISNPAWDFNATLDSIKKTLIKTDQAIMEDLRQEMGLYNANGLATVFLDIPFDSLLSIEEKRVQALSSGILLTADEDFVPASMRFNGGEPFPVKIRLKGDWTDHLVGDKWSFRSHESSASTLQGRRRCNQINSNRWCLEFSEKRFKPSVYRRRAEGCRYCGERL